MKYGGRTGEPDFSRKVNTKPKKGGIKHTITEKYAQSRHLHAPNKFGLTRGCVFVKTPEPFPLPSSRPHGTFPTKKKKNKSRFFSFPTINFISSRAFGPPAFPEIERPPEASPLPPPAFRGPIRPPPHFCADLIVATVSLNCASVSASTRPRVHPDAHNCSLPSPLRGLFPPPFADLPREKPPRRRTRCSSCGASRPA
jgi:hypothetical protein